ncbi:hypothetical protein, partial [Acidisphaera rubrifaciens]|uniref:hypothetical protein n=1 Tax=Acidisphaera rubrifaciens TaxID=50715 RepID=UPI0011DE2B71
MLAVFGYAGGEVGLLFGMYRHAHMAYVKGVALIGHVMIAVIILQRRRTVRRWLRPRPEATGPVAAVRRR